MKALDRAGSFFLRSILKRMKALGLNQSALARRMNVSRAYVSKVFAGDVNISFQTACRFAKALEMDFMPGLAPKKEGGARQGVRGIVAAVFCALAFACQAEVFSVPSWLPEDQRFEVSGTSNEIEQVERTLAAMRDAFHPKLIEMMRRGDSATNGYPSAMGPTLEWIVHVSLRGATNETAYFESYKKPLDPSAFDCNLLTNRAARLSYLPPTAKLAFVFDDGRPDSISRAIPGVDYPGVSYEDEGSTSNRLQLVLRAPKNVRYFRIWTDVSRRSPRDIEFRWVALRGAVGIPRKLRVAKGAPLTERISVYYTSARRQPIDIAVFAREQGGPWGVPARISATIAPGEVHEFTEGQITSIDYGGFKDWYLLDEQNRILGFSRSRPDAIRSERYSNLGEQIIETYPDDKPKTTRKVKYAVLDGKLTYEVLEKDSHYKNGPMQFRNY